MSRSCGSLYFDVFDVQPYDYLVKPLLPGRFERTMKRLAAAVRNRAAEDEEKVKAPESKLAQVGGELSRKDNDTYRRQNASES